MKNNLQRISITVPEKQLEAFDQLVEERGYANRSQAVTELINREVDEHKQELGNAVMAGTITLFYRNGKYIGCLSLTENLPLRISISDITGKQLLEKYLGNHTIHQTSFDLSNFANGVYIIQFDVNGEKWSRRVVVQR